MCLQLRVYPSRALLCIPEIGQHSEIRVTAVMRKGTGLGIVPTLNLQCLDIDREMVKITEGGLTNTESSAAPTARKITRSARPGSVQD